MSISREEFGLAFVGGLKAMLKELPGDLTVDELLASVCATPESEFLTFAELTNGGPEL